MPIKTLPPKEFKKELKDSILIDVRSHEEYTSGHIQNAVNIDINSDDFFEKIQKIEKDKKILVYRQGGSRSFFSAKLLESIGFKEIVDLEGGFEMWNLD